MERVLTSELGSHVGERVRLAGWIHHRRRLGRLTFVVLRDRAGLAQAIAEEDEADGTASGAELLPETVVELEGVVVASDRAPGGAELHEPRIDVVSAAAADLPVDLRRPDLTERLPTILDHAAVALRHPRRRAVFALSAAAAAGFRAALDARGFTEIHTPKLVGSATESGANVFGVDYFGRPAFLAQSPQLYKQVLAGVFERVYEVAPVFRAEPHETTRHLAEYVSLDAELAFVENHFTVMEVARDAVAGMVDAVRTRERHALELLGVELPAVPDAVPSVDFAEAQRMLEAATGERVAGEPDLAPAHERWLGEWARREHGSELVFVVGYPMAKRPFYTHPDPDRSGFSNSFDLLFRGVEVITGGQRLHRYEDYLAAFAARGDSPDPYAGYLEAFRYGMPPHGGFAIGLERWMARLVGAHNVRETTLFPRDRARLTP
jgi:nondiscriminating aspartyl-tRNA synthetase